MSLWKSGPTVLQEDEGAKEEQMRIKKKTYQVCLQLNLLLESQLELDERSRILPFKTIQLWMHIQKY